MKYPYIKINYSVDTEAIDRDVKELKNILKRLSLGLGQEIIVIMGDDIIRIDENNDKIN